MATLTQRVHHEAACIEGGGRGIVAAAVLAEAVQQVCRSHRFTLGLPTPLEHPQTCAFRPKVAFVLSVRFRRVQSWAVFMAF
jgi:hypothetical protein